MHYKLKDFTNSKYPYFALYDSIPHQIERTINKLDIEPVMFEMSECNYKEFNRICDSLYKLYCSGDFTEGIKTSSGGIQANIENRMYDCYFIHETKKYKELTITSWDYGCYRFMIGRFDKKDKNGVSGQTAIKEIYKKAKASGVINIFKENAVDKETGLQIKEEIDKPLVKLEKEEYLKQEFNNVHHIDLNSSYSSRIVEAFPELKPMYEDLYRQRKDNDGRFKSVLNASVGAFQSEYCIDVNDNDRAPYQMTKFAKIAVNGTVDKILEIRTKMIEQGFKPLLYNTDGIWYTSDNGTMYHDNEEGPDLCQWKHDHTNCKLYIKKARSYQYLENDKVHTILSGLCKLDKLKPREEWEWRDIDKDDAEPYEYVFDFYHGGFTKVYFKDIDDSKLCL